MRRRTDWRVCYSYVMNLIDSAKSKLTVAEWEALAEHFAASTSGPEIDTPTNFANAVVQARWIKRLSRKALAEQVSVSYSYLSNIEAGTRYPSRKVLERLEQVLGTSLGQYPDPRQTPPQTPPAPMRQVTW